MRLALPHRQICHGHADDRDHTSCAKWSSGVRTTTSGVIRIECRCCNRSDAVVKTSSGEHDGDRSVARLQSWQLRSPKFD